MAIDHISARVFRYDPLVDTTPRYQEYSVPRQAGMTAMDVAAYIQTNLDPTLNYEKGAESRGRVNGRVEALGRVMVTGDVTLEPLTATRVIKDLVSLPEACNGDLMDAPRMVPLEEAASQVRLMAARVALMHLAFARTLTDALGDDAARDLVVKSMMEYGRLVGERVKAGGQDLPHYGLHVKYTYGDQEFVDHRDLKLAPGEPMDLSQYRVYGCMLSEVFRELGEEELGRLYCYVDAAKSMAARPEAKLVHTACEVCGDDHCAFDLQPTTEGERRAFADQDLSWKDVDPLLAGGGGKK